MSGNFRACLLVPSGHTAESSPRAAVWASLQRAAAKGRVNVQQFPVAGDAAHAGAYVNGAVAGDCDVVVAADAGLVGPVEKAASAAQQQRFLLVGGGTAAGNVDVVADAPAVSVWLSKHVAGA